MAAHGARTLPAGEQAIGFAQQQQAATLAARLPALIVAAKEVASSLEYGIHGRRRAGLGENFWQYRLFVAGESASRVDWRRSARDDHVYVREREWESAHTVWLWIDRSASMAFMSKLARQSKLDRAVVLAFAAADLLVRGGERVGLLGLSRPVAARNVLQRFGDALAAQEAAADELPRADVLASRVRAVLFGDFLVDPEELRERIRGLSARGARGHLMMIADPIEETFPFTGHTEFLDTDGGGVLRVGQAERFRADYVRRLAAHRDKIAAVARDCGWSLTLHRTDRPAAEALLGLRSRLEQSADVFARGNG